VIVVAAAAAVYYLQRDRRRFIRLLLRGKNWIAHRLGRHWPDEPMRAVLDQYYD